MKPHWTLLVLIASTHFLAIKGLKLVNNGYEDLYIVIQETVQESEELLERIQETFTDASELLFKATHRRTYFRSVKVIIPKTWTKKDSYLTVSSLSSSTSHIKIGNTDIKMPFTVGSETCGQEGMYIFLPSNEFILHRGRTLWGQHDSVIVHEWGHLRWGLKDEYPTIKKIVQPRFRKPFQTIGDRGAVIGNAQDMLSFYQSDAMWKPVGCTRDLKGYASSTCIAGEPTGNCDQLNVAEMIGDNCLYCPDMAQTLNSSIMGYQYIPSVVEFCDIDSPATPEHMRHNSAATNEQNTYCNGKSAWEIMREHEDFKDGNNPPLTDNIPPSTQFQFVQEISNKVRVLVLDTSGSMATGDRITNLYKASKYIIESLLPEGSWLRIIDFDSSAIFLSDFVQINSATRPSLVSSLPKIGDGGTCIPCGLDLALSALNSFQQLDSIEESEVILISDGQNNAGDLEASTQKYVNAGVVVMCIAVTEAADQRLIDLAARTRGRIFAYSDLGSTSLAALFSEIISGGLSSDPVAAVTILNEPFSTTANTPINVTFNIDEGLGNATTVSVLTKTASNIQIRLTGPNRYEQTTSASQVEEASLVVPGVSEQGVYIVEVTSSTSLEMEVIVTSVPASVHVDIIRTVCRLSSGSSDVSSIETLPIMYVYVRKGESPVKKANVEVRIEGPSGKQTCILHPYDDGRDPDIRSDDGIYTAKLLQTCQEGNGRHNSKVVILGTEETVVTNYKNSGSAFIDFEANEAEDKETGNFKRMAIAEAITVSNYDASITSQDRTPPGRITDVRVIDIQSSIPSAGLTRNYTITWTATGDDFNNGQASSYEMRISTNQTALRHDFINADRLNVTGVDMAPNISGKIERLQMTVSSNDAFTSTTYFAIVAIDDVGNRGKASNIIPITIGLNSHFEVVEEECTDDCYSVIPNCGRNLTIPNGQVNMTNALTTAGHSVPLICDTGYKLTGGTSIECLENGKWNGNVSCLIQDCGRSETIENGRVNFTNIQTTYGSSALVICDTGYNLIGGTSINCLADGVWNKSVTCEIVDCGRSETIENGRVNFTHIQTTYGSSAPVICDTGYNLIGGTSINCLADGVWNKTVMCEIVDCGRSETIENGKVNFTNIQTTYGSSAPVICDTGYNLRGEPDVTCLADGSWNKSVRCEIVDCGRPKPMANGRIDMTNKQTTYGSSAPVFCSVGFKLKGGHKIECLADGTWSQTVTCQIFDRSSESESHIKTEVMFAITASCVAMYFLCIIGLLAWTVIRKKRELDIRKLQYPKDSLPINANRLRSRTLAANANIAYEIEDVESLQEQELTEARTQL